MYLTYSQIGFAALALTALIGIFGWLMVAGKRAYEREEDAPLYPPSCHLTKRGFVMDQRDGRITEFVTDPDEEESEWWSKMRTDLRYWDGSDWVSALTHTAPEKAEGTPSCDDWKHCAVKGHHQP